MLICNKKRTKSRNLKASIHPQFSDNDYKYLCKIYFHVCVEYLA